MSASSGDVGAPGSSDEFVGADELIADLAALLDAGLVVAHESVLGPARYGVAPAPDDRHADHRRAFVAAV